jgi:hypothetical protein
MFEYKAMTIPIYKETILNYAHVNNIKKHVGDYIIGFGKYDDFYMFWINYYKEKLTFSARIKYNKAIKNNVVRYDLETSEPEKIKKAMECIWQSYLNNDTEINPNEEQLKKFYTTQKNLLTKLSLIKQEIDELNEYIESYEKSIAKINEMFEKGKFDKKYDKENPTNRIEDKVAKELHHAHKKGWYDHSDGLPNEIDVRGKIKCLCGNIFLDTLDECPVCHESTISILRKKANLKNKKTE